nr:MAG TPA: hypothetical protein [Bacteriophage sp.]
MAPFYRICKFNAVSRYLRTLVPIYTLLPNVELDFLSSMLD